MNGELQIGESSDKHSQYHTLVLSTQHGEEGVQLTKPAESEGETRFVLIAGEPLDQEVVQVRHPLTRDRPCGRVCQYRADGCSTDLSWSIPNDRLWRL